MSERGAGVWRLRVLTGYTPEGKPAQRSKTVYGNRRQAQTELAKFVAEAEAGRVAASGATTFGRYVVEQYLPQVKANLSPETYRSHASRINGRIARDLGHVRLDKLTAHHLDLAYRKWRAEGLAASTVRAHHMIISSALTQALKWGLVPRSVAPLATLPTVEERDPTLPSLEQIAELVRLAKDNDPVLSAAIMLAALTGCRRGELCGLRWSDIDRERMVLYVRRAAKRADGGEKLMGPTKTHATRRLSIDAVTLGVFDEHRARAVGWARGADVPIGDDGFVLTWDPSSATPANPDVVTTKFARLTEKAGCPQVRFHDLRHAVATTLLAEGTDVATVAARLGHASPVTTMRVYAHVLEAHDRKAASVMGALLASTKAE
ncbi:MAG: tyrosine-type recombinase/integrase [Acidimicrobiales bacterium]